MSGVVGEIMFLGITEFVSTQQGDSAEFISKVQAVVAGVVVATPAPQQVAIELCNDSKIGNRRMGSWQSKTKSASSIFAVAPGGLYCKPLMPFKAGLASRIS